MKDNYHYQEPKYIINQPYFNFKRGKEVEERDLSIFLSCNRSVWASYAQKCGEPVSVTHIGMDEYDRPDGTKILRCFLEDLIQQGIITRKGKRSQIR